MLKTVSPTKRNFDCYSNTACSPHTISFLDCSEVRSAKRIRTSHYQPEVINEKEHKTLTKDGLPDIWGTNWGIHAVDENKFLEWVPKKSRGRYQKATSRKDTVFSTEDVQLILAKAIEETKEILKKQYDQTLQDRLAEQYENFSRFNQDHLHRKMESSQFDYLS